MYLFCFIVKKLKYFPEKLWASIELRLPKIEEDQVILSKRRL